MVKGMLQLLSNCPPETAHLRKELLIAAKHILTTDLRSRMYYQHRQTRFSFALSPTISMLEISAKPRFTFHTLLF